MNTLLEKLDSLVARFEEVGTLITDPNVISDQQRYVRLTKEYKELEDLMAARKEYATLLGNLEEGKDMLVNETDPDLKEMAREQVAECEEQIPPLEEKIKLMLVPKDPEDSNMRLAPSLPAPEVVKEAMEVYCTCLKLAALRKLTGALD